VELIVQNLGRVKRARIDVRPLTIFIGPNHTNKTWTAYSLYGIACNLARVEFSAIRNRGFMPSEALQQAVNVTAGHLFDKLTERPAAAVKAGVNRDEVIHGVAPGELILSRNAEGLCTVLGVSAPTLTDVRVELRPTEAEFQRGVYSAVEVVYKPSEFEIEWNFARADGSWQPHPYRASLGAGRRANGSNNEVAQNLRRSLAHIVEILAYTLFDNVAVLPSERKALVSFGESGLSYSPAMETRTTGVPSPITDFLYMIGAARRLRNVPGARPSFSCKLSGILERQIIQGTIRFEDEGPANSENSGASAQKRRESDGGILGGLNFATSDGVELPIHASASIVRSLTGLDVYLKEFCDRGGLLVVDEAEMNAHPDAQLKIIEFLALLAQSGVRVVLTTHSPYIVDHLSNLMQASRLGDEARKTIARQFKLESSEAFLSPDDVSVYLFNESGEVSDILDRGQGFVDLTSFSDTTEYMANLVNTIWKAADDEVPNPVEEHNAV
jgi:AAA ATPase domain